MSESYVRTLPIIQTKELHRPQGGQRRMPKHVIPIREFLASLPLFETLEPAALARLAAGINAVDAPKGTVIVRRGDSCVGFHVVVFGRVKLCLQTQRGDEKVVDLLTRG